MTDREIMREAIISLGNKTFRMADVEAITLEKHQFRPNSNKLLPLLDQMVSETEARPINGRQLFPGHTRGFFFWLELDEEELAEKKRLARYPR